MNSSADPAAAESGDTAAQQPTPTVQSPAVVPRRRHVLADALLLMAVVSLSGAMAHNNLSVHLTFLRELPSLTEQAVTRYEWQATAALALASTGLLHAAVRGSRRPPTSWP